MQLWFSFGIALVAILVLAVLLWKSQKLTLSSLNTLSSMMNSLIQMNQTMLNLLSSKDPMTFQSLQAVTSSTSNPQREEFVSPLDDESVAKGLAERYEKQGLDPNSAYAQDDIDDFRTEFGL